MHEERITHINVLKGDIFATAFAGAIKQGETKLS
jgi:hypothetical protein